MEFITKNFIIILLIFSLIIYKKVNIKKVQNTQVFRPKISIYLPIYNKETFLKRSIRSLQKQTLKEIEIIGVNDYSTDNSYNILKNLSLTDNRIKIVNNSENKGLLYSRSMGVLYSKGEYIMDLDPDDEIFNESDLEYLYSNTNNSQIDIINFGFLTIHSNGAKNEHVFCNLFNDILLQPKLFDKFVVDPDFFITNKIIKKEIYLKAYEAYKGKIYGEKCNYADDEVWSGLINKYANSKKCVNRIVYVYHRNIGSLSKKKDNFLYCLNLIDWNEMFIYNIFLEKKEVAKTQTIRFLDLIKNTYVFFNSIKSNKTLTEKYINYLSSIKGKFIDDKIIIYKINNILNILFSLNHIRKIL